MCKGGCECVGVLVFESVCLCLWMHACACVATFMCASVCACMVCVCMCACVCVVHVHALARACTHVLVRMGRVGVIVYALIGNLSSRSVCYSC